MCHRNSSRREYYSNDNDDSESESWSGVLGNFIHAFSERITVTGTCTSIHVEIYELTGPATSTARRKFIRNELP